MNETIIYALLGLTILSLIAENVRLVKALKAAEGERDATTDDLLKCGLARTSEGAAAAAKIAALAAGMRQCEQTVEQYRRELSAERALHEGVKAEIVRLTDRDTKGRFTKKE